MHFPRVITLAPLGLSLALGVSLARGQQKMYWTAPASDKIQRADLDGANVEDLVTTGLSIPTAIALDLTAEKVYWAGVSHLSLTRASWSAPLTYSSDGEEQ